MNDLCTLPKVLVIYMDLSLWSLLYTAREIKCKSGNTALIRLFLGSTEVPGMMHWLGLHCRIYIGPVVCSTLLWHSRSDWARTFGMKAVPEFLWNIPWFSVFSTTVSCPAPAYPSDTGGCQSKCPGLWSCRRRTIWTADCAEGTLKFQRVLRVSSTWSDNQRDSECSWAASSTRPLWPTERCDISGTSPRAVAL